MKEKIPEELRKEFEQAVLNADLDHWMVDNDRQFLDKIWDAVDKLFNQEVEKRIAEVLPTKNEIGNACQLFDKQKRPLWKEAIWRAGANWAVDIIRSRLTCSEKPNNSQKTEGGEE
jgi:DNA polymerase sigma